MGDIIKMNASEVASVDEAEKDNELVVSTLGAGVSSLLPALRTVTQTTTVNTQGLYQLANVVVGDILKVAKNGNFWGAFKTADGASKFAQLHTGGLIRVKRTARHTCTTHFQAIGFCGLSGSNIFFTTSNTFMWLLS